MKFDIKGLSKPTPKVMIRLGNSLLAAGLTIASFAIAGDLKVIGIIAAALGGIGKFLSSFYVEELPEHNEPVTCGDESNHS